MGLLEDIAYLTTTVEAGSFASASRRLGVTASAVSRRVAALEDELGARLLARTTRTLRLTDDGRAFYEQARRILEQLDDARGALARAKQKPTGLLRVECAVALSRAILAPHLAAFLARYPELEVQLIARDDLVDLVAESADVALRIGPLRPANLIARKLGDGEIIVVGAPAYLKRRGTPRAPADLARHAALGYARAGRSDPWRFAAEHGATEIAVNGPFRTNDLEAMRAVVLAGRGLVSVFDFLVADDLVAGRLVRVLAHVPGERWPIHALYPPNRHLLPKVRVFLDFVAPLVRRYTAGTAA